jgi:HD-like signal output (HDOD) protein/DNA-binding response OmpR family regulator
MNNTVLVVDDLPIIRDPIAAMLRSAGFRALCASDGVAALEILRTNQVDLILLDVKMPVMDGMSFLRVLRRSAATAGIPVMMLSGEEERDNVLQAAKLGIRGYVLKSNLSLKDLLARVIRHFSDLTQNKTGDNCMPAGTPASKTASIAKQSGAPSAAQKQTVAVPAVLDRDQCLARAKQALHGKTLSGVVAEVVALAASPRSSAADLTAIIARDPLMSARVLQVANSSAYASSRGRVSTLTDAVRNIGSSAVKNIAAALGVFNAMPSSDSNGLNLLRCWQHSFAVATLSNHLTNQQDSGFAYLIGLCHDLGEILFHSAFADEYRRVLELEESTGGSRSDIEKQLLGLTRSELLQTIVSCLELPKQIGDPILEYQSHGPGARGGSAQSQLLKVADLYANGMLLSCSNLSPIRPLLLEETNAATGQENPPAPDSAAIRGEILSLTATLSRFSPEQQAQVMAAPFPRRPIRIGLVREPGLSTLDPTEVALQLLADVVSASTLPNPDQTADLRGMVVLTRSSSSAGFGAAEIKKASTRSNGSVLPTLWLAGRNSGSTGGIEPIPWVAPLATLASFIANIS